MPGDSSLTTLTEDWIVSILEGTSLFDTVEPFPGNHSPDPQTLVKEMLGNRSTYACVLFEGDTLQVLEEHEPQQEAIYGIYIAVQNLRGGGSARRGDGTKKGTNWFSDILRS